MRKNVKFRTAILYSMLMVLMTQVSYFGNFEINEENQVIEEIQEPSYSIETGTAILIDSGGAHSCAISAAGEIKCWGKGSDGQLGIGNILDIGDESGEMGVNLPFLCGCHSFDKDGFNMAKQFDFVTFLFAQNGHKLS